MRTSRMDVRIWHIERDRVCRRRSWHGGRGIPRPRWDARHRGGAAWTEERICYKPW